MMSSLKNMLKYCRSVFKLLGFVKVLLPTSTSNSKSSLVQVNFLSLLGGCFFSFGTGLRTVGVETALHFLDFTGDDWMLRTGTGNNSANIMSSSESKSFWCEISVVSSSKSATLQIGSRNSKFSSLSLSGSLSAPTGGSSANILSVLVLGTLEPLTLT